MDLTRVLLVVIVIAQVKSIREIDIILLTPEAHETVAERALKVSTETQIDALNFSLTRLRTRDELCSKLNSSHSFAKVHLNIEAEPKYEASKLTADLYLPTLSIGPLERLEDNRTENKTSFMRFLGPSQVLITLAEKIVSKFDSSRLYLFYDSSFEQGSLGPQESMKSGLKSEQSFMKIQDGNVFPVLDQLQSMDTKSEQLLLVLARMKTLEAAARELSKMSNKSAGTHFVFLTKNIRSFHCSTCIDLDLTLVQPTYSGPVAKSDLVHKLNLTEEDKVEAHYYYDLGRLIVGAVTALIRADRWSKPVNNTQCESTSFETDANLLDRVIAFNQMFHKIAYTSEPGIFGRFTFQRTKRFDNINYLNMQMVVRDIHYNRIGDVKVRDLTNCRYGEELQVPFGNRRKKTNLVKITTIVNPPFVMEEGKEFKGFLIDLFNKIQGALGALKLDFVIEKSPDGVFGTYNETENAWNGMVRDLLETHELALGPFSVTLERSEVISYSEPIFEMQGITFLRKNPDTKLYLEKFITVMDNDVWTSILAAYVLTSVLLSLFDRLSPYSYRNNKQDYENGEDEKREFTVKESLWFCFTSLTPQGGGEAPKNLSGRLIAATWWLFGFIMMASYTANLAAFLTVSRRKEDVDTLEELHNQNKVNFAPVAGSATLRYFEKMAKLEEIFYEYWRDLSLNESLSDEERENFAVWDYPVNDIYTRMLSRIREQELPSSFDEALQRVESSDTIKGNNWNFAWVASELHIDYAVNHNCKFYRSPHVVGRKPVGLAFRKNSKLKDLIDPIIRQLKDNGIIDTLYHKWWYSTKLDCGSNRQPTEGVTLNSFAGTSAIIVIGLLFAFSALLLENIYFILMGLIEKKAEPTEA